MVLKARHRCNFSSPIASRGSACTLRIVAPAESDWVYGLLLQAPWFLSSISFPRSRELDPRSRVAKRQSQDQRKNTKAQAEGSGLIGRVGQVRLQPDSFGQATELL